MIAFVVHNHSLSDRLTKRRAVCQTIGSETTNFHDVRLIFPRYAGAVHIYIYNHGQKSWDTCISGAFSNSHRPNPSLRPTNNVGLVYPEFFCEFQLCKGWGRENCEKISKRTHCFIREPINYGKL